MLNNCLTMRFFLKCILGLLCLISCSAQATQVLYLSPTGRDSNSGVSEDNAVKSLSRVWEIVQEGKKSNSDYRVNILPGEYIGQATRIVIDGDSPRVVLHGVRSTDGAWPVFKGKGTLESWLVVRSTTGKATNIVIEGLTIQDYFTAIILTGTRWKPDEYNSGTIIQNNIFRNIGSIASKKDHMSTAAIAFINSRNNEVLNNKFYNIRNKSECPHLHALYIAHQSSGNIIKNNLFDGACGAPIRLRDRSNDTQIFSNKFVRIEDSPAVQEWYCDKGARRGCSNIRGECPSINNVLEKNIVIGDIPLTSLKDNSPTRPWCETKEFESKRYHFAN